MEDEPGEEKKRKAEGCDPKPPRERQCVFRSGHGDPRLESLTIPLLGNQQLQVSFSHGPFPFRPPSAAGLAPQLLTPQLLTAPLLAPPPFDEEELTQDMQRFTESERERVALFVGTIEVTKSEEALMSVITHFLTEGLFLRRGALKSLRLRVINEDLTFVIEDLRRTTNSFSNDQIAAVREEVGEAAALHVTRVVSELPRFGNMAAALSIVLTEGMARLSSCGVFAAETWRLVVFWFVVFVLDPSVRDMEEEEDEDNEDDEDEDQGASAAAAAAGP